MEHQDFFQWHRIGRHLLGGRMKPILAVAGLVIALSVCGTSAAAGFTIQPSLLKKSPYDPQKDFAGVTLASSAPYIVVVHPSLPVKNVKELIALAKAKPGQLNNASSGVGSGLHLAAELFNSMAGVKIVSVQYKGSAGITDLIAGGVQLSFTGLPQSLPHVKSGRLRPLAVTSAKRFPLLPEIPTIAESGVPNYEVEVWYGMLAPARTPVAVLNKVSNEVSRLLATPEMKEHFASQGLEARGTTPAEFQGYIARDVRMWARVVKMAGLQGG